MQRRHFWKAAPDHAKSLAVRELNHRISNEIQILMSIMRTRSRQQDAVGRRLCAGCLGQASAIAHLHEVLRPETSDVSIDLAGTLDVLCRTFREACAPDGRMSVDLEAECLVVDAGTAESVALIVNEALTNALKHGFPGGRRGRVQVTLARQGDGFASVSIRDDGSGQAEGRTSGSGSCLIDGLARQISARVERSRCHPGFRLAVEFRVPAGWPTIPPNSQRRRPAGQS